MTNDIEWHWQPLYCQASNIKLKIFEKLHFDVFKKKKRHKATTGGYCLAATGESVHNSSSVFCGEKGKKKHAEGGESSGGCIHFL